MADLIEVVIDSLRVSLTNQQRIVILKAVNEDHYLPIWVGPFEAEAITIALQEVEVARPQTHDLLNQTFQLLKANLQKVDHLRPQGRCLFRNHRCRSEWQPDGN